MGETGCALALGFGTSGALEAIWFPPGGWKMSTESFLLGGASELYPSPFEHVEKQAGVGGGEPAAAAPPRQEPAPRCLHPPSPYKC